MKELCDLWIQKSAGLHLVIFAAGAEMVPEINLSCQILHGKGSRLAVEIKKQIPMH